jgi:hypothetical protein
MTFFKSANTLYALVLLSACGGASGSGVLSTTGPISIQDVNDAGSAYFAFAEAAAARGVIGLSPTALAAQGAATYDGYMLGVPAGLSDALVGRTQIDASFVDGGSLTGEVSDLILIRENEDVVAILTANPADGFTPIGAGTDITPLSGGLTLSNGALRTQNGEGVVDVTVSGTVNIPGDAFDTRLSGVETFAVTGGLRGAVAETGEFVADGTLQARGSRLNFNLGAVVFAQ